MLIWGYGNVFGGTGMVFGGTGMVFITLQFHKFFCIKKIVKEKLLKNKIFFQNLTHISLLMAY